MSVELQPDLVEALALRVAEIVQAAPVPQMLKVDEVAHMLRVKPEWVYEHADDLGVYRLGNGDKGRLRFDRGRVLEHLANGSKPAPAARKPRRQSTRIRSDVPLLRVGPKR